MTFDGTTGNLTVRGLIDVNEIQTSSLLTFDVGAEEMTYSSSGALNLSKSFTFATTSILFNDYATIYHSGLFSDQYSIAVAQNGYLMINSPSGSIDFLGTNNINTRMSFDGTTGNLTVRGELDADKAIIGTGTRALRVEDSGFGTNAVALQNDDASSFQTAFYDTGTVLINSPNNTLIFRGANNTNTETTFHGQHWTVKGQMTIGDVAQDSAMIIGDILNSNTYAGIMNSAVASSADYAVLQKDDGNTFLNCATSSLLHFRKNNASSTQTTFDGANWTVKGNVVVGQGNVLANGMTVGQVGPDSTRPALRHSNLTSSSDYCICQDSDGTTIVNAKAGSTGVVFRDGDNEASQTTFDSGNWLVNGTIEATKALIGTQTGNRMLRVEDSGWNGNAVALRNDDAGGY